MKIKFIHVLLAGTLAVWVGLGAPAAVAQQLRPEAQAGGLYQIAANLGSAEAAERIEKLRKL